MSAVDMKFVGKIVRDRREKLGLSQEDVAANGGPSTTTLSKIENGDAGTIRARTARDLERVLGWSQHSINALMHDGQEPQIDNSPAVLLSVSSQEREKLDDEWLDSDNLFAASEFQVEDGTRRFLGITRWPIGEGERSMLTIKLTVPNRVELNQSDFAALLSEIKERVVDLVDAGIQGKATLTEGNLAPMRVVTEDEIDEAVASQKAAKDAPRWNEETEQ